MKEESSILLVILLLTGPYLLLFYKKVSFRIRLLFVSIIEIFIFCAMITIVYLSNGFLEIASYYYGQFASLGVFLNFILIICSWVFTKIARATKPKT